MSAEVLAQVSCYGHHRINPAVVVASLNLDLQHYPRVHICGFGLHFLITTGEITLEFISVIHLSFYGEL